MLAQNTGRMQLQQQRVQPNRQAWQQTYVRHRVFAWQQQTALSFQLRASCSCLCQNARPRGLLLLLLPAKKVRDVWLVPARSFSPPPLT